MQHEGDSAAGAMERPPEYYADSVAIASSSFTFALAFGMISVVEEDRLDTQCVIRMSPHHFKVFSANTVEMLRRFEEANGVIALPATPNEAGSTRDGEATE